jgi:hypothetical protein
MRVPKTLIVHRGECELGLLTDGVIPEGFDLFESRLRTAMDEIGYPCFLRTGQMSDKHNLKDTCFIENKEESISKHVAQLVETSYIANIAGLPFNFDFWVVREMIPTKPMFHHFNGMPITRELRFFVKDGGIQCVHPYWPDEAFLELSVEEREKLKSIQLLPSDDEEVYLMAKYIARYFDGWSVDFLQDSEGTWWCTDMAVAERSYHHPGCDYSNKKKETV